MSHNIFFIRTPKCATTTLKEYILQFANHFNLVVNDNFYHEYFYLQNFNVNTNHIWSKPESWNHFLENRNPDLKDIRITSIRNPLDRLRSAYYHYNRHKNKLSFDKWYVLTHAQKNKLSDDGWAMPGWGDRSDDCIINYLGIENPSDVLEKYDFVTVAEHFSTSIKLLESKLDFQFFPIQEKNKSDAYVRNEYHPLVLEIFNNNNQKDLELYQIVCENFL